LTDNLSVLLGSACLSYSPFIWLKSWSH